MNRIVSHLRGNAVAYLALFIALGGSSYAAFVLPANSVGTKQIRNHAITPIKLDPKTIAASVRAWAVIQNGTKVVASRPRARVVSWDPTFAAGIVSWGSAVSKSCFPLATGSGETLSRLPFFQALTDPATYISTSSTRPVSHTLAPPHSRRALPAALRSPVRHEPELHFPLWLVVASPCG